MIGRRGLDIAVRLVLAASVLTVVPFALLTALVQYAPWSAHWLEPIVLAGLPAASIPVFASPAAAGHRRHWWAGLIALAAAWYLLSPHIGGEGLAMGGPIRTLTAEIELFFYGAPFAWSAHRVAVFTISALAAVGLVSIVTWYVMTGLQWASERTARVTQPAQPVTMLSRAAWASRSEVREAFSTQGGIILGEHTPPRRKGRFDPSDPATWRQQGRGRLITLDPRRGNAHSLVFSGSGSFKTAGVAIPNALMYDGPLIIIDPKGEIHDLTAAVRSNRGRKVWQITADNGLDPIKLLTALRPDDGTIFSDLAEFLLPTTGLDQSDGSAFFHQKAVRLLSALLAHLHHAGKEGHLFAAANRELSKPPARMVESFEKAAKQWEDEERKDLEYITVGLREIANTEERQRSGVVATVANGLEWSGQPTTRGFLASKEPDGKVLLNRVQDGQTDIMIRIPTPVIQASPGIARALIGTLVRVVRESTPASTPAANRVHRLFIIDEARALRRMDYLAGVRDEGRAYGIHLMQIFQSWQQLRECYGSDGAGAWENSVDAIVIGPVSDAQQARSLSQMIGQRTVTTESSARQRSSQLFMPFSGSASSSETTQLRETELIKPAELRQLPPEAAIILATGAPPILASKAIWFTRPDMAALVERPPVRPADPTADDERELMEYALAQGWGPVADAPADLGTDVNGQNLTSPTKARRPFVRPVTDAPGLTANRAFEVLRETAQAEGCEIQNMPDFQDILQRMQRERSLPGLPDAYRQRLEANAAWIARETGSHDATVETAQVSDSPGQASKPGRAGSDVAAECGEEAGNGEEAELQAGAEEVLPAEAVGSHPTPSAGRPSRPAADLGATAVDGVLYRALIEKASPDFAVWPTATHVLADPTLNGPPNTTPHVIVPHALGPRFDRPDAYSIVFVPDDGRGPVMRLICDADGTIIAWTGPYRPGL
ncbi:MAG: type IV secretory system conjugative DNA transfer family protein [Gemmatimonadota bacterium]|nr:type IV secretory system conjugative DNA transfer family protein [Gemmatimonadota bacterium]